jgi:hypothetical protein
MQLETELFEEGVLILQQSLKLGLSLRQEEEKVFGAFLQIEHLDQHEDAGNVVRVKVTDENGVQHLTAESMPQQLTAAAFTAVKQEMSITVVHVNTTETFVWKRKAWSRAKDDKVHLILPVFF